jgi:glycosyl transferase, family 25
VRAYVINLARSADRRANVIAQLTRYGVDFEMVVAVDGRELDLTDTAVTDSIAPSFLGADWFRPGHAACAMSHLSVYRRILADGLDHALVLEDDVTVPVDVSSLADAVAEHLTGAEIALLSFDSASVCRMNRSGARELPSGRQLVLPVDVSQPVSGAGYVITREACVRMVERAVPIRAKCDNWAHFYHEKIIDNIRCIVPLAIMKDPSFASTIGYYSDVSLKARLLGFITRHELRTVQRAIVRRRERIWRRYAQVELVDEHDLGKQS